MTSPRSGLPARITRVSALHVIGSVPPDYLNLPRRRILACLVVTLPRQGDLSPDSSISPSGAGRPGNERARLRAGGNTLAERFSPRKRVYGSAIWNRVKLLQALKRRIGRPALHMRTPASEPRQGKHRNGPGTKTGSHHSTTAMFFPIRNPILSPAITALEYLLLLLKSRRRLPVCRPLLSRHRQAFENSPDIRRRRRGTPPRPVPPRPCHLPSPRLAS